MAASVPGMRAAYAARISPDDPLAGLEAGDLPEPSVPDDWVRVEIRASSLNHHDLWSLRGVGLSEDKLPMILGCDASGVGPDGSDVVVFPVVVSGATSGHKPTIDLRRLFYFQQEILGATMGTPDELAALMQLLASKGVKPIIDSEHPFSQVRDAFERLASGEGFGKVVVDHTR